MNDIQLSNFEKWVLKKRSIWFHIIVSYFTAFIWTIIYFVCKLNAQQKLKAEKIELENKYKDIIERENREKTTLIFDKSLKVSETSHPKRQKALKDIYFILEHGDTPDISANINDYCIELSYQEIDSNKEQAIGIVYDYATEIKKYYDSPDYAVITDFEVEKENDVYNLYFKIKIYN